jgi:anaerobic magnesium-protoporphyrin IX monomethyl ester cyclase
MELQNNASGNYACRIIFVHIILTYCLTLIFVKEPTMQYSSEVPSDAQHSSIIVDNCLHNCKTAHFGHGIDPITEKEIDLLVEKIHEISPDIIGLSTRSFFKTYGKSVMERIKENFADIPFVCGGFGPAFEPEWYLNWANYVAFGEYDWTFISLLELAEGNKDFQNCHGLIYKDINGTLIRNPINRIPADLDDLPFPDWDNDNKFLIWNNRIVPGERFQNKEQYFLVSGRGCPGSCSYCMAWRWTDTYRTTYNISIKKCRLRSPRNVIEELKIAKLKGARFCQFEDPMLHGTDEWIDEFTKLYSTEINLPFRANVHPLLTSNATLEKLIKIGLKRTCVGIQSGSYRVRKEIFNRNISNEKIIGFCEILDNSDVFYSVHIIGWNPLEFIDDYEEGLQLFLNLKPKTDVKIFRLQVFPGSKLEEKFKERNKDSLPDKIPLPDKIHLYYAYLFSYIFNNKRSRQFGLKNHISKNNEHINDKAASQNNMYKNICTYYFDLLPN